MSSQTSNQHSDSKMIDDEFASKQKRLHPRPKDDELKSASNSKKLKTANKSVSKSKLSTQKKCEVTFSEDVEEIKDGDLDGKENKVPFQLTPLKDMSPSKQIMRSTKLHIATPYSKIKENQDCGSILNSSNSKGKNTQPNFEENILKSDKKNSREMTPTKILNKSLTKSMSKSPLGRIKEEKVECEIRNQVIVEEAVPKSLTTNEILSNVVEETKSSEVIPNQEKEYSPSDNLEDHNCPSKEGRCVETTEELPIEKA